MAVTADLIFLDLGRKTGRIDFVGVFGKSIGVNSARNEKRVELKSESFAAMDKEKMEMDPNFTDMSFTLSYWMLFENPFLNRFTLLCRKPATDVVFHVDWICCKMQYNSYGTIS